MSKRIPPGPNDYLFGIRLTARMKADVLGTYAEMHRQFGDIAAYRAGPFRVYIFYHPDHVRSVLVQHAKSTIRMPRVMDVFAQWNGNSVLIAEGEDWIRQRRLVQPAFHPRRMAGYAETMVTETVALAESWRNEIEQTGHLDVDIDRAATRLTLSIICQTMFHTHVDELSEEIAEAVALLSIVSFDEMQAPVRIPNWLPTRRNRRKRAAIDLLDRVVWRFIKERRSDERDHGDLLSMLLRAEDDESAGSRLSDQQVRDEAMTLMLAGHDTTAAGLDWLFYNLAKYPEVRARCQQEIDLVVEQRNPEAADTERLPYLVATIKESLRLYPPAIGVFLRQATKDFVVGGYDVPRGSLITFSSFVTQRDARWFPEPEAFRPERFLPGEVDKIPQGAYFPFGMGPRVCIGQTFAMTEMTLVAATLLQHFDVALPPNSAEPSLYVTMALRPRDPLILRWTQRLRSS